MISQTLKLAGLSVLTLLLIGTLLFAVGVLWPLDELEAPRTTRALALTGVDVIDVRHGSIRRDQTVVVESARIVAAGDRHIVNVPASAEIIDGRGRYVVPALWDMHAHVYAVSPLLDLPLYIAYGVTNVRDMQGCPKPGDPFVACADDKRRWTNEAVAGARIGPRIAGTTSWMANGPGMAQRLGGVPEYFDTATPEQARRFVRHFDGSVDAIKVYDRLPRPSYFALVDEARRRGMSVVGHRPRAVSAVEAAAHQKSIEHARFILHESYAGSAELRASGAAWKEDRRRMLAEHDPRKAEEIFRAMAAHGTWYVPTHLTRWSDAYADTPAVRADPLLRYLHPLMRRQWEEDVDELLAEDPSPEAREIYRQFHRKGLELTGAAHRAGVRVLAGTDYLVAGADLHREMQQLVAAGLTPAEALRAATWSAAEYFELGADYGTVEAGRVADLLLLRANPLEDIRNSTAIEAVVFNGNLYDRAMLDAIENQVASRARSWGVGCRIVWRFLKNPAAY